MIPVMSEEDLINLKHDVDRHEQVITEDAIQIAALKSEIEDLKEGIRELIDAVEDLSTAKGNVAITTPSEEALKRFGRRIEGLRVRKVPMMPAMSDEDMKISRLIEILKMVQKKHGDIRVSKNGRPILKGSS
jgi:prefoldin subunit 5